MKPGLDEERLNLGPRLANASAPSRETGLIVCFPFICCGRGGAQRDAFEGSKAPPAAGESCFQLLQVCLTELMGTSLEELGSALLSQKNTQSRASCSSLRFPISHCGEPVSRDGAPALCPSCGNTVRNRVKCARVPFLLQNPGWQRSRQEQLFNTENGRSSLRTDGNRNSLIWATADPRSGGRRAGAAT